MIVINSTDTQVRLTLTLSEKETIPDADYLFVFTHRTTGETVSFTLLRVNDESGDTSRFNQFTIDATVYFEGASVGMWTYRVSEDDPDGVELETGIMQLIGEGYSYSAYQTDNTNIAYDGN